MAPADTTPIDLALDPKGLEAAAQIAEAFADSEELEAIAGMAASTGVRSAGWLKDALHSHGQEVARKIAEAIRAALSNAEPAGSVGVKPLDLSNLLQHAFRSGYNIAGGSPEAYSQWWPEYDPEECAAYPRVVAALAPVEAVPVAYQQRESRDDGKTWSDWCPTTREAFEEYTRNVASRYVSGKWTFEVRALYAHPPAQAGAVTEAISAQDPLTILAGIEQFGLAADGSDLRDLREALTALGAQTPPEGAVPEAQGWRPTGHVQITHDGFAGDIIGHYTTREGKRGVVVQQDGTRVVHVYGEKWLTPPVNQSEGADRG